MLLRSFQIGLLAAYLAHLALAVDISGTWIFKVKTTRRNGSPAFVFKQEGEALSGAYSGLFGKAPVSGTVKGDQVEFSFKAPMVGSVRYKGTVESPSSIKGEVEYGNLGNGTFTATKKNESGGK